MKWITGFLVLLSCSARGDDFSKSIERAYRKVLSDYCLQIGNVAKSSKTTKEFLSRAFKIEGLTKAQQDQFEQLATTPAPKVISIPRGLEIELRGHSPFFVQFGEKLGEVAVSEKRQVASIESPWLWLNPLPRAEAVAAVLRGLAALAKFIVGNSVRATAVGTAAGAVGGCYVGVETKYSHETLQEGCYSGAVDGALLTSGIAALPWINNGLETAIAGQLSSKAAVYLKSFGILGTLAAVAYSAPTLASMNGSILRCSGASGDFILSAKQDGATRHTLYEFFGGKLQLYSDKSPGPRLAANATELRTYLKTFEAFKALPDDHLGVLTGQILQEVEDFRRKCVEHGNGYSESLYFSLGRRVTDDIEKSTPARTTN